MNILITGAGGFIGIYFSDYLEKHYKVYRIFSSSNSGSGHNSYAVDLTSRNEVIDLVEVLSHKKIEVIIHLASKMASPSNTEDMMTFKQNCAITENMVFLAKSIKPKVFINFSSMSVYPNVTGLFSEDSLPYPQKNPDCIYGLSKYCSEVLFDFLLRNENIQIPHLRIAQVYGDGMPEDRTIPVMLKELERKNTITVLGNGRRESNFIDISKLVETLSFFLKNELSGVYNLGDQNLSYYNLAKTIIKQHGNSESKIIKNPNGNIERFNLDNSKLDEKRSN